MSSLAPNLAPATADENGGPFVTLRRWRRARPVGERCDLCGLAIGPEHPHLFEPDERRVSCACEACAMLFSGASGKFRRVGRRTLALPQFRCTDEEWQALGMPVDLVFFFRSTSPACSEQSVVALYPSPAGATEALPNPGAWRQLADANPELAHMEPDVEALLVNRLGKSRQAFLCPIDECYRLAGLVRARWRGLSGGAEVWQAVERFFAELGLKSA